MVDSIDEKKITCKNCSKTFYGNYCPECGQSSKEFELPLKFLIIDFLSNMFAFDTRFWKTFVAILFKPGTLALDFVKGHRVKYMPPFRFYIFISFVFFLLLSNYTSRMTEKNPENENTLILFGTFEDNDTIETSKIPKLGYIPPIATPNKNNEAENKDFLNKHPEIFLKQLLTNLSWSIFLLMPLLGFLLWLFYRKAQNYYITHFIIAINQHAFIFVVLTIILLLAILLPEFSSSFRNYLALIIPIYIIIGHKVLYKQNTLKATLKFLAIGTIYSIIVFAAAIGSVLLVFIQNGISLI